MNLPEPLRSISIGFGFLAVVGSGYAAWDDIRPWPMRAEFDKAARKVWENDVRRYERRVRRAKAALEACTERCWRERDDLDKAEAGLEAATLERDKYPPIGF